MKRINKLLVLAVLMVLPIKVFALTGEIKLTCDKTDVNTGDTIVCKVSGTVSSTDDFVTSISAVLNVSTGYEITSFKPAEQWEGDVISDGKIDVYTTSNSMTGTFDIGTLNIKVNGTSSGTLNLTSVKFGDKNSLSNNIADSNTINFSVVSTLSNLTVTGGKLQEQGVNKFVYEVVLDANTTNFGLVATPTNASDTVTYTDLAGNLLDNNNIKFELGENDNMLVNIKVGNTTYNVAVKKDVILDNTLATLTVGGKNITLSSGVDEYTVTLDSNIKEYEVKATLTDPEHFKISDEDGGVGKYQISTTSFIITVEPKDASSGGSKRVYRINVKQSGSGTVTEPQTPSGEEVTSNPTTSDISIFVITIILLLSFAASIYFYKRNMENYN